MTPPSAQDRTPTDIDRDATPTPILDRETIEQLRDLDDGDGDGEILVELVEMFVTDLSDHLDAIAGAIAGGDDGSARRSAHAIAGGAATIGAPRLSSAARAIERTGAEGRAVTAGEVDVLQREAQLAVSALAHPTVAGRAVDTTPRVVIWTAHGAGDGGRGNM